MSPLIKQQITSRVLPMVWCNQTVIRGIRTLTAKGLHGLCALVEGHLIDDLYGGWINRCKHYAPRTNRNYGLMKFSYISFWIHSRVKDAWLIGLEKPCMFSSLDDSTCKVIQTHFHIRNSNFRLIILSATE